MQIGILIFLVGCQATTHEFLSIEERHEKRIQDLIQNQTIPDTVNTYLLVSNQIDVHVRPNVNSPVIRTIRASRNYPRVYLVEGSIGQWVLITWTNRDERHYGYVLKRSFDAVIVNNDPVELELTSGNTSNNVVITGVYPTAPNSADGVDIKIGYINTQNSQTLKYFIFEVVPFNRVGDVVVDTIRSRSSARLRATGPFSANGQERWSTWPTVFYNRSLSCIELRSITLVYADDSIVVIDGDDVDLVLHDEAVNTCEVSF